MQGGVGQGLEESVEALAVFLRHRQVLERRRVAWASTGRRLFSTSSPT